MNINFVDIIFILNIHVAREHIYIDHPWCILKLIFKYKIINKQFI